MLAVRKQVIALLWNGLLTVPQSSTAGLLLASDSRQSVGDLRSNPVAWSEDYAKARVLALGYALCPIRPLW